LNKLCIALVINSSEKLSRADVGSSKIIILGSFKNIFAIANLCFCHQLNFIHLSQISVFIQLESLFIKSHFVNFITFCIFSSEISSQVA
jgi:hypothetical protein